MDRGSLFNLNDSPTSEDRPVSGETVQTSDDVGRIRDVLGPKLVHSHTPEEMDRQWRFRKELISLSLTILLVLVIVGGLLIYARVQGVTFAKAVEFVKSIAPASESETTVSEPLPAPVPAKKATRRSSSNAAAKKAAAAESPSSASNVSVQSEPIPYVRPAVHPLLIAQVIDSKQRRILEGDNTQSRITVDWTRQSPLWSAPPRPNYGTAMEGDNTQALADTLKQPQSVNVRQGGGELLHQVMPSYPAYALQEKIQGAVVMQALVGRTGNVTSVHPISGPPSLVMAAVDAVRQWRYAPYMRDGEAEEFTAQITVDFALTNGNGK